MLPREAYVDDAVLAWERELLFRQGWVCVGRADDLAEPGQQKAFAVGDEGVIVVRGDGRRAARVLQHLPAPWSRAAALRRHRRPARDRLPVPRLGLRPRRRAARSPGRCTAATYPTGTPFSLDPVRVEEWHGFVMVNLSGDAAPLADHFAGLDEIFDRYSCGSLRRGGDALLRAGGQLEAHRGELPRVLPLLVDPPRAVPGLLARRAARACSATASWIGGDMELDRRATRRCRSTAGRTGSTSRASRPTGSRQVIYLQVTPNLLVSLHPDYVMTHRMEPVTPGRTKVECQWLFPPEAVRPAGFDPSYAVDFWDLTNRQDWTACESVQRGPRLPVASCPGRSPAITRSSSTPSPSRWRGPTATAPPSLRSRRPMLPPCATWPGKGACHDAH